MQSDPVKVYRRSWCEDSDAAVDYFKEHGISYTEVDIEEDANAGKGVEFITGGHHITPTLVYQMNATVFDPWDAARFEAWWSLVNSEKAGE
jgi:mycoredoxin